MLQISRDTIELPSYANWNIQKISVVLQPYQGAASLRRVFDCPPFPNPYSARDAGMGYAPFLLAFSIILWPLTFADPDYHERLNLQPLTPASLLASFSFWSNASLQSYEQQHFQYLPRSLGQILQHAKTKELHLRFSTGRWDDESWGKRPWGGMKEGGTGVELWAWVESDSEAGLVWDFNLMRILFD